STGQTETYGYDATGQFLTSYTDSSGTTAFAYVTGGTAAQNNALASITNVMGGHVFYSYDPQGRLISQSLDGGAQQVTLSYGTAGGFTETDPTGQSMTMLLDAASTLMETIDGAGNVTTYSYNAQGKLTQVVDGQGDVTTYHYDANGNQTSITDPLGHTVGYT